MRRLSEVALLLLTLAGCSVAAEEDTSSGSAEALTENDLDSADDFAKSFFGDDGKMPQLATAAVSSPFPYTSPTSDVSQDLTRLVDAPLTKAVQDYSCQSGEDHKFAPYFPGIQAFNDAAGVPGIRTLLGGDEALANLYVKYAQRAVRNGSTSDIQGWSLLSYYNMPTVNRARPGAPVYIAPEFGSTTGRGVRAYARSNHSNIRLKEPTQGASCTLCINGIPREGDQIEARMIGLWAATPNDKDFIEANPQFLARKDLADRDAVDFGHFRRTVIGATAWANFMYRATYEVAVAWKCGTPVFAHSGGGAVATFITRVLMVSALGPEMKKWTKDFRLIGLEAVLSNEMNARGKQALGHVAMQQFAVGAQGSKTYAGLIVPEATEIGQTPLNHIPMYGGVNPPGWNGDGGGHGGLGFTVLLTGRLQGQGRFGGP